MIRQLYKNDTFLKNYTVFFSGSMLVAILNYAFHPLMGRFLVPSDFGEIQAMLSLITQSAILFGAFSVVAINITANATSAAERNAILFSLQKIALVVTGVAILFMFVFIKDIQTFFNFSSVFILLAVVLMWPISAVATFRNAYLQGKGEFTKISMGQVIASGGKLVLAIALVSVGFGIYGAVVGVVAASVLFLVYLVYYTYKDFPLYNSLASIKILEKGSITKELRYGLLVFFATSLVTVYYTSDVLIVKHFFSAEEAGLYSGISAIAKILFFIISPVTAVLVSAVKLRNTFRENSNLLAKALVIAVGIGGTCLCTFYLFNDIVIKLMLGNAYGSFSHFLPKVSLVMFLAAVVNIFILYFLALRRFFLVVVSVAGVLGMGWILLSDHSHIDTILNHFIFSLITIIGLLVLVYGKDYFYYRTSIQ